MPECYQVFSSGAMAAPHVQLWLALSHLGLVEAGIEA